jgi:chloride channel protein, CIC family
VIATTFSYASGGAGGIFAPTLFIGGTLGGALGVLDSRLLGHVEGSMGAFALVGMGAVFAGTIRAPITSVLIIIEMTGGYSLILPLMIANMTAYVLARRWRPTPIYEALLLQDGVKLQHASKDPLDEQDLERFVTRDRASRSFRPETTGAEMTGRRWPEQDAYPVIDATDRLVGLITSEDLRALASEPEVIPLVNAADLMRPAVRLQALDGVHAALDAMVANGVREIPIIDAQGRVVGFVDEAAIAKAYLTSQRERRKTDHTNGA